jgi:hypothetical protein
MANSKVRSPILTVLLSVLTFLALDALVFRSGLYARLLAVHSVQGNFFHFVQMERARPSSGRPEVLLSGNSHMNAAFSMAEFHSLYPGANLTVIRGARFGIWLRPWYYILQHIDPSHDRYAAIVIPLEGYRPAPEGRDYRNVLVDMQVLAPIATVREWEDLVEDFTDPELRREALWMTLFAGHVYAADFQNFFLKPFSRTADSLHIRHDLLDAMTEEQTDSHTLQDLTYDLSTKKVTHSPSHFSSSTTKEVERMLEGPGGVSLEQATERLAEYETKWLNRIVDLYKDSPTKIIFVYIPSHPFPMPSLTPLASAPDLRQHLPQRANVIYIPEDNYAQLDDPKYFCDMNHLNHDGGEIFTRTFSPQLISVLHPSTARNP